MGIPLHWSYDAPGWNYLEPPPGKARRSWKADLFCIALLLVLNPAAFFITSGPKDVTPDSAAYITMGTDLLASGLLYLPSWGHVDIGLILPPLYPLLIGIGRLVFDDGLVVARLLSSLLMLLSSALLFVYTRRCSGRTVAVCAVLLIQANYYYLSIALTPLTEAVFICALSCALLFGQRLMLVSERWKLDALLLGIFSALVYLSRQIGFFVAIFFVLFVFAHGLSAGRGRRTQTALRSMVVLLGFSLLFVPYLLSLHTQTGHLPFEQRFRMGAYTVVKPSDEETRERSRGMGVYDLSDDIYSKYAKRRERMKLLPDGSEMYLTVLEEEIEKEQSIFSELSNALRNSRQILSCIVGNFGLLAGILGSVIASLFLLTAALSLLVKDDLRPFFTRTMLPLLILTYLFSISLFTDLVERYLYVIFPFVIVQIAVELHAAAVKLAAKLKLRPRGFMAVALLVLLSASVLSTPQLWLEMRRKPRITEKTAPFTEFRRFVSAGDPVMSILAPYSFYAGGTFRYLPNDSLEKTVHYARLTGVRWLLVTRDRRSVREICNYAHAQWFADKRLDHRHPALLRLTAVSFDRGGCLYEILPDVAEPSKVMSAVSGQVSTVAHEVHE